jgi:hypothetical protein
VGVFVPCFSRFSSETASSSDVLNHATKEIKEDYVVDNEWPSAVDDIDANDLDDVVDDDDVVVEDEDDGRDSEEVECETDEGSEIRCVLPVT